MKLQKLLIELRGVESIPKAAKRIGISATYLRMLEKGIDSRRGNTMKPTQITLRAIAKGYKIDYLTLLEAAGFLNDINYNPDISPLSSHPKLQQWYNALPNEDIKEIERLYVIWNLMKGCDLDVLRSDQ